MEFENAFYRPGKFNKIMDFRENVRVHGKVIEFQSLTCFSPNISCCLKTGNILLVTEQKYRCICYGLKFIISLKYF